jgi:thioredoxin-related protein
LQQVLDEFKTEHFDVVTINIVPDEKGATTIMNNYRFTALMGADDSEWSSKTYGVDATPTSFLLDTDGKLLFRFGDLESIADMKTCEEEVRGLLQASGTHSE